ncbi:hypothetical protein [Kitasatospora cinereorecta]|uniref:WD40 repeat domain-containing protein n=1 Tax=Kitasatospora cinereorecta TaxID=285560 RepID=A0ABW0V5U2_9ACTN
MTEGGWRIPALGAGRRPAGLALFGWLDDPRAPRLCRVAGSAGSGKSHLLAWLVQAGTTEETPGDRRVHAVLPAAGASLRAVVWSLGQQLGVVAHRPGPLLEVLAADERRTVLCVPELDLAAEPQRLVEELLDPMLRLPHVRLVVEAATGGAAASAFTAVADPAVLDLDEPQWTDRERFAAWAATAGADPEGFPHPGRSLGRAAPPPPASAPELIALVARTPEGKLDLRAAGEDLLTELWTAAARIGDLGPLAADPLLWALARPVAVTAAVEGRDDALARPWDAVGPALAEEPDPAVRAAVLRTRLLGTDPAAAAALPTTGGRWVARWAQWSDGRTDPVAAVGALTVGAGEYVAQLLVTDPTGAVRTLDAATGRRLGTVVLPAPRPWRGLAVTSAGAVVLLDGYGGAELVAPTEQRPGLEPYALQEALDEIAAEAAELTAVAAVGRLPKAAPAFGDAAGVVHWYQDGLVESERLHRGAVTALAGTALAAEGRADPEIPLLASGGLDGAVRLWGPGTVPMNQPIDLHPHPVTAVAVGTTAAGPVVAAAWADGLVRLRHLNGDTDVLDLRVGPEVHALAMVGNLLVVGTPDGVAAIDTH